MATKTIYYKGDKNQSMEVPTGDIAYWAGQGWGDLTPTPTPTPTTTPTKKEDKTIPVYWKDGTKNEVPASEQEYWENQGWTTNLTDVKTDEEAATRLEDAKAIIQQAVTDGTIPQELADIYINTLEMYPDATDFDTTELLEAFQKVKDEEIDPYYQELMDLAIADAEHAYGVLTEERAAEREAELARFAQEKTNTQADLERRGMTMSGEAAKILGSEAGVISYEGQPLTGEMKQRQNLIASSSLARAEERQRTLGRNIAGYLGSDVAGDLGIPGTGGVNLTGSWETDRENKYASALQRLINQWKQKQDLLTN